MPLPELVKTLVEKKVGEYCKRRVPAHALDQVNVSYKIRGSTVTIFENRAPWRPEWKEWTSMPVAQMRFVEKIGEWMLFCSDRNNKWHEYPNFKPTKDIDVVLAEIGKDPTGIFRG